MGVIFFIWRQQSWRCIAGINAIFYNIYLLIQYIAQGPTNQTLLGHQGQNAPVIQKMHIEVF